MTEPIRILRVIARLNVGGPALHVAYLTKGLEALGYETTLVAGRVGSREDSMEYAASELGVAPVFLPNLQREIAVGRDLSSVRILRELIREHRPHIVHTHTAKAGAVGRLAAITSRLPQPPVVVHTFHGHVLRGYFNPAATAAFKQVERRLATRTDRLIAVSPEVRDDLVALGVAPASKFEVIRLGLDLAARTVADEAVARDLRAQLGIGDGSLAVAWLGRMTGIKRLDVLLHAFASLRRRGTDAHLVLAGDGPLRESLERLAADLAIADRTHFVGMRKDVAAVYGAADVVALTSANEGTPVSLIEALASGTPVVSTDVGGVRDVVLDDTGFLVADGDAEGVAAALARFADDPDLRARFGEAARERTIERFSVERLVDDVDGLYRRLLAERRSASRRSLTGPLSPALGRRSVAPAARRLRIALLTQYFPPEVGATQSRMQTFAEHLAARGHQVTVICEFPNHPQGVVPEGYRGRLYEDDRSNPYRVLRVWVKADPEKTQRTRMKFYLSYMAMATATAPLLGRVDVVFATSPPLFTGVAGYALARLNRAPFVLDVRDLWPAAAASLNQLSTGAVIAAAEGLERFLYRQASAVTAVTRPFCAHVDAIRGKPPATALIPNGTLEAFFDAEATAEARAALGAANGAFTVTFAGNFGIAQALGSVVDAAALAGSGVHFALVGDGPMREIVEHRCGELGVDNVTFVPQLPLEQVPPLLAASDALLVPLSGHPTFRDFVPSKLIDYMAVGRPVLLSAAGESRRILERAGGGLAVAPEDPRALADGAAWLRDHPREAAAMAEHGRAFARSRLRSSQAERLEALLDQVVAR
ncbi:MAG TPA: glycosyltransferase [Gaiellaceae bacterium]|nr:glycosyltransferase [Gaiellaceae bacterium]